MFAAGSPEANPPEASDERAYLTSVYSKVKKVWSTRDKYPAGKFIGRRVESTLLFCSKLVGCQSLEKLDDWTTTKAKAADKNINQTINAVIEARKSGNGLSAIFPFGSRNALVKEGDKPKPKGVLVTILSMIASFLPASFLYKDPSNTKAASTPAVTDGAATNESTTGTDRGERDLEATEVSESAEMNDARRQTMFIMDQTFGSDHPEDRLQLNDSNSNVLNKSFFSEDGESIGTVNAQDKTHGIDKADDDTQDLIEDIATEDLPQGDKIMTSADIASASALFCTVPAGGSLAPQEDSAVSSIDAGDAVAAVRTVAPAPVPLAEAETDAAQVGGGIDAQLPYAEASPQDQQGAVGERAWQSELSDADDAAMGEIDEAMEEEWLKEVDRESVEVEEDGEAFVREQEQSDMFEDAADPSLELDPSQILSEEDEAAMEEIEEAMEDKWIEDVEEESADVQQAGEEFVEETATEMQALPDDDAGDEEKENAEPLSESAGGGQGLVSKLAAQPLPAQPPSSPPLLSALPLEESGAGSVSMLG